MNVRLTWIVLQPLLGLALLWPVAASAQRAGEAEGGNAGGRRPNCDIVKCVELGPISEDVVVKLLVDLGPLGHVIDVKPLEGDLKGPAPAYRRAHERARRALYCASPLTLPREKYGQWQRIVLTFDPRYFREASTECRNSKAGHKAGDELGGW